MPIGAVRRLECGPDGFLDSGARILASKPAPVVVERRPGKVCNLQQNGERVLRLEILDGSNLQRRSGDLKARNFPK